MYNKIKLIEAAIAQVAPLSSPYLDEVNSFPSVTLLRQSISSASRSATISRQHIGRAVTLDSLRYIVRGYTYTSIETALDDGEALARKLEDVIQSIKDDSVYSSTVVEVSTDEGLFAPYSIIEIHGILEWINE